MKPLASHARSCRRSLAALCALIAAGCAVATPAAADRVRARIPGPVPVVVEAERITMLPSGVVRASGDVQVTRGDDSLTAQDASYDPRTEQISARGNAVLSQPGRRLTGESLTYSAGTGEVAGESIRASLPSNTPDVEYRFRGRSITGTPREYRLQDSLFTTCERNPPHFAVRARQITFRPGESVSARRVSLLLMGKPLFTIPRYTARLNDEAEQTTLLPRLILGSTDRVGLRTDLRVGVPYGGTADLYGVLSLRHTLRAGIGVAGLGSTPLGLHAGFKEEAPNRFVSGLTVSVLPAITFYLPEVGSSSGSFRIGMPRQRLTLTTLAEDIRGGNWSGNTRYRFVAGGSAGRFAEHPTEVRTTRLSLAGAFEVRPFQITPQVELCAALRGRLSYYGSGERYGLITPQVGVCWRPTRRDTLHADLFEQIARGTTPFIFDRAPASRSLFLGWKNRTSRRKIEAELEYDVRGGTLYGWSLGYSRRIECLQPGVSIHQSGGNLGVGLTLELPGLGG